MVKSCSFHLKAFRSYICGSRRRARRRLTAAIDTADAAGLKFEAVWAARSMSKWFGSTTTASAKSEFEEIPFFVFP